MTLIPDRPGFPWFSFNEDERVDAERVVKLEWEAQLTEDPTRATHLLGVADQLRERWDRPRQRFSSLAEIVAELTAIANEARECGVADYEVLENVAVRGFRASSALETLAWELEAAAHTAEED